MIQIVIPHKERRLVLAIASNMVELGWTTGLAGGRIYADPDGLRAHNGYVLTSLCHTCACRWTPNIPQE